MIDPGVDTNILRKFHKLYRLSRNIYLFITKKVSIKYNSFTGLDGADEDYDEEEDPELVHDSIYHLNMGQYLRDFLLNFSTHHCFPMYLQHLNVPELKVLNNININALM